MIEMWTEMSGSVHRFIDLWGTSNSGSGHVSGPEVEAAVSLACLWLPKLQLNEASSDSEGFSCNNYYCPGSG